MACEFYLKKAFIWQKPKNQQKLPTKENPGPEVSQENSTRCLKKT